MVLVRKTDGKRPFGSHTLACYMPLQAAKVLRCIALPIFNLSISCVVNTIPQPLYPMNKLQRPFYRRMGGPPGPIWTDTERKNLLPPLGFKTWTIQPTASNHRYRWENNIKRVLRKQEDRAWVGGDWFISQSVMNVTSSLHMLCVKYMSLKMGHLCHIL
jgi:hypothetical protein